MALPDNVEYKFIERFKFLYLENNDNTHNEGIIHFSYTISKFVREVLYCLEIPHLRFFVGVRFIEPAYGLDKSSPYNFKFLFFIKMGNF